ncbi:hypothetical protein JCM10207_007314 [Rhodosporidiobolus poonsookiae]
MSKQENAVIAAAVDEVQPAPTPPRSLFFRFRHWLLLNNPDWTAEHHAEQSLVRRLDTFFVSFICLSAITKYLDQIAISNAYVSGMKEDLKLYGNELNYFTTFFNIGYIVSIPLSSYLMNGPLRPSIVLPTAELIWGLFTGLIAIAKDAKTVYGLRFGLGFAEGGNWPGTMILLLSWYTPSEVGLRIALYQGATTLGGIFAGVFQAALYTNLDGVHGLRGYQWLFVVNACITGAVAFYGYYALPDYPNRPNPAGKWLKQRHIEAALARTHKLGRKLPSGWTIKKVTAVLKSWRIYAIWFAYEVNVQAGGGVGYFNLWLKSLKNADGTTRYTVQQLNHIPIAGNVINIVSILTVMSISDRLGTRWPFLFATSAIGLIFSSVLAHWHVPDNVKFASFLILNMFIAWLGSLAQHSAEERSIIISTLVVFAYVFNSWAPILTWPAKEAPHYRIGWNYAAGLYAVLFPALLVIVLLARRQERKQRLEADPPAQVPSLVEEVEAARHSKTASQETLEAK